MCKRGGGLGAPLNLCHLLPLFQGRHLLQPPLLEALGLGLVPGVRSEGSAVTDKRNAKRNGGNEGVGGGVQGQGLEKYIATRKIQELDSFFFVMKVSRRSHGTTSNSCVHLHTVHDWSFNRANVSSTSREAPI